MFRVMWNGTSGMYAEQEKLNEISNNIANMDTVGYKSEQVSFSDLVYESLNDSKYPTSSDKTAYTGTGVKANGWIRNNKQGNLSQTNINTDFAISGSGYFRVTTANGTKAYERNGKFNIDGNGKLVDGNGNVLDINYSVDPNSVQFKDDNIVLLENGEIGIKGSDKKVTGVGKIDLYDTVGDDSMLSVGNNLFVPKNGVQMTVVTDPETKIYQGRLEDSNVDLATEMTDMIVAQRAFESSSKSIKMADEMWQMVNNLGK